MGELEHEYSIAEKFPSQIKSKTFLANKGLIILTILFFILLYILGGYLFDGRQGNWIILSVIAVLISVFGFVIALKELAKIQIENALINICHKRGKEYLQSNEREDLNKLLLILSKQNESQPAINRLIEHIVGEAKMNKFDSGITLMQPYKDESVDVIFSLQNYQKIALWIGIAGTFIGILLAMQSSDFTKILESGQPDEFVKIIPQMFNGLVVSFSASLAGLLSAVIIGCLILIIRKQQQVYFQKLESVINVIINSARKCSNEGKLLFEIDLLRDDLNKSQSLTEELQKSTNQLQKLISEMQKRIIMQNEKFQESVNKFFESNDKILHFAKATEEQMKYVHSTSLLKLALQESIQLASDKMSDSIANQVSMMTGQFIKFSEITDQFNKTVQSHSQIIQKNTSQTGELNKGLVNNLNNLSGAIRNIKLPQNLAIWVVVLTLILGIVMGLFSTNLFSFSSEQNKSSNSLIIPNTENIPKSTTNTIANRK